MAVTINGSAGVTTNSGAVYNSIQGATAVASTSGTSIDFTGIPSWVERITVMFNGVSTSGTSNIQVQLGAGSVDTSGYLSTTTAGTVGVTTASATTGHIAASQVVAAALFNGHCVFTLIGSNLWIGSSTLLSTGSLVYAIGASNKTLSGTLDRVRITTVNGTDTFDAGSINILYE